jgi:nitroimidazol reductase NimA-like FMN-containing flavoprotein (pyridoxamine 5'-phosphate oxidase superfamily)
MSGIEQLTQDECRELLRGRRLARIAYCEAGVPQIRPVNFSVSGRHLLLRVAAAGLGSRLSDRALALEVDDVDVLGREARSVVVAGTAVVPRRSSQLVRVGSAPPSWAGEGHHDIVILTVAAMSGRRVLLPEADQHLW